MFSCTKEDFTTLPRGPSVTTEPIRIDIEEKCTNFTPTPVDVLLLVDNSGSISSLETNLKSVVKEIVKAASNFFDYRIYIAPLLPLPNETLGTQRSFQIVRSGSDNSAISAQDVGINQVGLPSIVHGVRERGFKRAVDLLRNNSSMTISNGSKVFRDGAYLVVTTISNGDDNDYDFIDAQQNKLDLNTFSTRKAELLGIKTALGAPQLRYMSVVNHTQCGSTVSNPGLRYKTMSYQLYSAQAITDSSSSTPDSYNLCGNDISQTFEDIANTIKSFRVGHRYNFWPLGTEANFDPGKLSISKKVVDQTTGKQVSLEKLDANNSTNGFVFINDFKTNLNIREFPSVSIRNPAETHSGFFASLHGTGKVTYPDCLVVRKEDFTKYFGYLVIEQEEPNVDTLKVIIDGKEVAQGGANGWEYLGFRTDQNILVKSPSEPTSATPGIFKTGYVIKLNGTSIYNDVTTSGERGYVEFLPKQ